MITYDSKRLIPAPFVSISKDYQTTDDGKVVGTTYQITLRGSLVTDKGSPNSSGTFWDSSGYPSDETVNLNDRLGVLMKKQAALRSLFSNQGRLFEIQSDSGTNPLRCNPRVKHIEFPEGGQGRLSWVDKCDYVITLEADKLYSSIDDVADVDLSAYKVAKATEEWNIETLDENLQTYRLSHSVSAIGKRFYQDDGTLEMQAWEQARGYVLNVIGLGLKPARMEAPGVLNNSDLQAFNYVRTQSVDEMGGKFAATETWICFAPGAEPPAIHTYTVNTRTTVEGRVTVSIDGSVTGMEQRNNTTGAMVATRWTNAIAKFNTYVEPAIYTVASVVSGVTLNAVPASLSVGKNPTNGVINYNYEFDNRATPQILGATSEVISVTFQNPTDVFAVIPVLGRAAGPVLQSIGTKTVRKKVVTIEAVLPSASQVYTPSMPDTNAVILGFAPGGSTVFVDQDEESFVPAQGRYHRVTSYTWEV
jgi:hypothetical protein